MKKDSIKYIALILIFFVSGCATNPPQGSESPMSAREMCNKQASILYTEEGHLYTTSTIASILGYTNDRELMLSYFSQYPDIDPNYDATYVGITHLLIPFNLSWRNDITGVLHSLHGGDQKDVDFRRKKIKKLLSETIKNPKQDVISGLLIHAFADSYAHTKDEFGKNEVSYGPWIGHAVESIFGQNPDDITIKLNQTKYIAYVISLYDVMKKGVTNGQNNDSKLTDFIDYIKANAKPQNDGFFLNFHTFNKDKHMRKIDMFAACMQIKSRPLTKTEVQNVINSIKN